MFILSLILLLLFTCYWYYFIVIDITFTCHWYFLLLLISHYYLSLIWLLLVIDITFYFSSITFYSLLLSRYPLLIKAILKYTTPDHPDHANLTRAQQLAEELCNRTNEVARQSSDNIVLRNWQKKVDFSGLDEGLKLDSQTRMLGPRQFIYEGTLTKVQWPRGRGRVFVIVCILCVYWVYSVYSV